MTNPNNNHATARATGNTMQSEAAQPHQATETDTMHSQRSHQTFTQLRSLARVASALGVAVGLASVLSGCSTSLPANFGVNDPASAVLHISGTVNGGQNPISGALVQLYAVGTTGLQAGSTGLITAATTVGTTTTTSTGSFNISGLYNCPTTTTDTDVYLVATGGNAGSNATNSNISLVAAIGSCNNLVANASTTHIQMNEVTTVAAAFALAPFATSYSSIGATFVNGLPPAGLTNAFSNAAVLASTSTGTAGALSPVPGVSVPIAEIYTLGNILAACVNTNGAASTACNTLFSATGASDTFGAALGIAKNPGSSAVISLWSLPTGQVPFNPNLLSAPNDFSIAVTYAGTTGSLLNTPYGIAIDATGNAWVANESGSTITEFTPSGTSASYTASGLFGPQGIAIDTGGDVWVANTAGNSVVEFPSGNVNSPTSTTVGGTVSAPSAIAIDHHNNVFVTNFNGNSVTGFSASNGTALANSPFTGSSNITVPTGIALDRSGNVYVTSGGGSIIELTNAGAYSATLNDGTLQGPVSVAIDSSNRVYATGFTTGSAISGALSEFSGGTAASVSPTNYGLTSPAGLATDSSNFAWVANSASSGSLFKFSYGATQPAVPLTGFGYGSLNLPIGVALDSSGSIWVTNSGSNTVAKFIGLAAPVTTPLAANVGP